MSCRYCMQYAMQGYDAYHEDEITKNEMMGPVRIAQEAKRVPDYIALVNIRPSPVIFWQVAQ